MLKRTRGFIRVLLLVVLGLIGLFGALSHRELAMPEMRGLTEPGELPLPPIPPDMRRPTVIRVHDVLAIRVADESELSGEYAVTDEGAVQLPMIGAIDVAGLAPAEAATEMAARLAGGYLVRPAVTIDVTRSEFQTVFVLGEINQPGPVTAAGALPLSQAIGLAGGPAAAAGTAIIVRRPPDPRTATPTASGDRGVQTFTLDRLDDAGAVLRDGDTVIVRPGAAFFLTGEVRNPGVYVLRPGMTVEQAVAIAGGLTDIGSSRGLKIFRITGDSRTEISASAGTAVSAGDVIRVGRRFLR